MAALISKRHVEFKQHRTRLRRLMDEYNANFLESNGRVVDDLADNGFNHVNSNFVTPNVCLLVPTAKGQNSFGICRAPGGYIAIFFDEKDNYKLHKTFNGEDSLKEALEEAILDWTRLVQEIYPPKAEPTSWQKLKARIKAIFK